MRGDLITGVDLIEAIIRSIWGALTHHFTALVFMTVALRLSVIDTVQKRLGTIIYNSNVGFELF